MKGDPVPGYAARFQRFDEGDFVVWTQSSGTKHQVQVIEYGDGGIYTGLVKVRVLGTTDMPYVPEGNLQPDDPDKRRRDRAARAAGLL